MTKTFLAFTCCGGFAGDGTESRSFAVSGGYKNPRNIGFRGENRQRPEFNAPATGAQNGEYAALPFPDRSYWRTNGIRPARPLD